ncbi:MAG: GGDEF domain-containing phosphodiesterase [Luteimonas sp.]
MLNRARFFAALEMRMAQAKAGNRLLGLLVLRTQRTRELDLLFGYEAGERFAAAMRVVIEKAVRPIDDVEQIGEHDFAVVLPDLHSRNHALLAAAKLVRDLQVPIEIDGRDMLAPVAVGVVVYPGDGDDAESLCRHADIACAEAAENEDRFAFYKVEELQDAFAHGELRDTIAANQLALYLQPIIRLQGDSRPRFEALSRWTHPVHGPIAPEVFVHVAEQTGLIAELTRWNLNASLRQASQGREGGRPFGLSVNLSVVVLQQAAFVEQILAMLRFWNVPAQSVMLEITESGLMRDPAQCERMLRKLRDQGFGIAIDDFGTGYSSMAYLRRLPATELKIDKTFVLDMADEARVAKLVGSMIDLSHHLGIEVVAEGVEDARTLEMLRELGCDHAQGYHLGRPLPATEALSTIGVNTSA